LYEIGQRIAKLDPQLGAAGRADIYLLTPRAARRTNLAELEHRRYDDDVRQ
jgi:hypothetical protein